MPEDVLEWGTSEPRHARARFSWADRLVVPPLAPYVLAGLGAIAYFVSISQPWRLYKIEPTDRGLTSSYAAGFADRHEYALTLGLGLGYTVAALVLAGMFPIVLLGSQRTKRIATGVGLAIGVMGLAQLAAVISLAGKDSVWFESSSSGLKLTVEVQTGLYAAFGAVVALAAAILATHYVGVRRPRPESELEPEYATDAPRDLTVTAS